MKNVVRRFGATLAGGALLSTALVAGTAATAQADEAPVSPSAQAALTWLNGQYLGLGQQADLYLGLDAVGGGSAQQATIAQAFRDGVGGYVNSDYTWDSDGDGDTEHYTGISSGAIAKTLTVASAAGDNVTSYGTDGLDLVEMLDAQTFSSGPNTGRLFDVAYKDGNPDPSGNYANTFGQAYAVRGLAGVETPEAAALLADVTGFLLKQQCEVGFFRLYFDDSAAPSQTCDEADPAEDNPQVDTTALVLIALNDVAAEYPEIAIALDEAETWLAGQQLADGSFPGDELSGALNTNTVGLGGWALGIRGDETRAAAAASWVRARQLTGSACDGAAVAERGAIAFTDESLNDGIANGIADVSWEWAGATGQAFPVLAWAPAATGALKVTAPAFVQSGKAATVKIAGIAKGERACVTAGTTRATVIGTGTTSTVKLVPSKSAKQVTVTTLDGSASDASVVLAAKKLKPGVKATVKRNAKQQVSVKGLAAGESVTVKLGGKKVLSGKANAKGVFSKKFKVTAPRGKATVTVTGQFKNRTGSKKFTVK